MPLTNTSQNFRGNFLDLAVSVPIGDSGGVLEARRVTILGATVVVVKPAIQLFDVFGGEFSLASTSGANLLWNFTSLVVPAIGWRPLFAPRVQVHRTMAERTLKEPQMTAPRPITVLDRMQRTLVLRTAARSSGFWEGLE